jgi:hypothetical protein
MVILVWSILYVEVTLIGNSITGVYTVKFYWTINPSGWRSGSHSVGFVQYLRLEFVWNFRIHSQEASKILRYPGLGSVLTTENEV